MQAHCFCEQGSHYSRKDNDRASFKPSFPPFFFNVGHWPWVHLCGHAENPRVLWGKCPPTASVTSPRDLWVTVTATCLAWGKWNLHLLPGISLKSFLDELISYKVWMRMILSVKWRLCPPKSSPENVLYFISYFKRQIGKMQEEP